ncbi:cdc42 effector protein 1 [Poecilia reticulata]|uniref:CDC42 effector protein (Rho GTPase binding) 1a n=1 Tax=Poecilia reticulata TaxID=8081 RepID=A0A3P9PU39_POERE|nr:PREDICTED: cdc42 effector protein 1-like [Poecilia reticulata]XP_008434491.1 PREDICTED: cdc42 effector protein 1-like [Poecilia reticulata]
MNLQEKLSGLKGLVSPGRRRHKGDLTADMISPPLGDFRHTMHVGRGGDVFGDTSFLSNHGGSANGGNGDADSVSSPDNKIGAFFSRTLRHIRRGSDNRPRDAAKELSPPPPAVSPIIKNAISLPRLDVDTPNGSPTARALFPGSPPDREKSCYGLDSGFVTLPRLSRLERQQPSIRGSLTDQTDAILSPCSAAIVTSEPKRTTRAAYSDSLPSLTSLDTFTFDLGPSLMSEVFGLIDGRPEESGAAWRAEEAESACGSDGSATVSFVDSLLREDGGGGTSPHRCEEENAARGFSGEVPDVLLGSAERVGVRMESERFQSATDVLARHYGVGLLKGQNKMEELRSQPRKTTSYSFMDDEEEIKV